MKIYAKRGECPAVRKIAKRNFSFHAVQRWNKTFNFYDEAAIKLILWMKEICNENQLKSQNI